MRFVGLALSALLFALGAFMVFLIMALEEFPEHLPGLFLITILVFFVPGALILGLSIWAIRARPKAASVGMHPTHFIDDPDGLRAHLAAAHNVDPARLTGDPKQHHDDQPHLRI